MGAYPVRYDRIGFLRTQDSLILFEISFLGEILAFVLTFLFIVLLLRIANAHYGVDNTSHERRFLWMH